ncbi:GapR family DNA-binding domain-containing protein [Fodinicurvata sp. EGI_FJ10296]|uniref:GapR family DNA-binding domain-containing protein n=1 Tax=Fodinicurvata sp. EGI_FJ10296 TaxID=3231908 RepID=UPI003453B503
MTTTFDSKSSTAVALPVEDQGEPVGIEADIRRLAQRLHRMEGEKEQLLGDIRDSYLEAKQLGIDVKALKRVVKLRRQPADQRQAEEDTLESYKRIMGLVPDFEKTPIGAHIAQAQMREAMDRLQGDPALAATAARLVDAFGSVEAARGAIEAVTAMSDQETIAGGGATVTPIGRTGGGRN